MRTVTELLAANLHDVFGNRDAAARRAVIDQIYTEDVVFTDPDAVVTGRDALDEKAAALLAGVPEAFAFSEDGSRYAAGDAGALGWALGPQGAPVARGIDIITVRDGQIAALTTMLAIPPQE